MAELPDDADFFDMVAFAENEPLYQLMKGPEVDMNQLVFPHESAEGGLKTMGFGHKFNSQVVQQHFEEKGMTLKGIKDLFKQDVRERGVAKARRLIDQNYGKGTFEKLDPLAKKMAADLQFNISGSITSKFPNFTQNLVTGNLRGALKEMRLSAKGANENNAAGIERRNSIREKFYTSQIDKIEQDKERTKELVLQQLKNMGGQVSEAAKVQKQQVDALPLPPDVKKTDLAPIVPERNRGPE